MTKVAIVGGGVSGLAAAHYLARAGIPSRLFERRARLGGSIRTETAGGCLVEAGADSWLAAKDWMEGLLEELGLAGQAIDSNDSRRRTFVIRRGRPVPLPESMRLLAPAKPWQALSTPLLGPAAKARMALEWFRRPAAHPDRSVAAMVRDHFGDEAVEVLAQPLLAGVYGSPPEALSAECVVPQLVEYERRYGSILRGTFAERRRRSAGPLFRTLRDGMGALVEALERSAAHCCAVERGRVEALERDSRGWLLRLAEGSCRARRVVLAVPAFEAGRLLRAAAPELARLAGGIGYSSSVIAALIYRRAGFAHPLDGFGLLAPRAERASVAACTWVNSKFAGRAPAGRVLLRAFLTGDSAAKAMDEPDQSIAETAERELERWMGLAEPPLESRVYRLPRAMPRYGVGHRRLIDDIESKAAGLEGLHLAGNGYDGLGIPDCVRRSRRIATAIAREAA